MKKILAILLALVLTLSLAACSFVAVDEPDTTGTEKTQETTKALASITVTVVHKDGSSKSFTYETDEAYVGPVLQKAGLIEGNEGQYGLEITAVDGEQAIYATDGAYWALYEGEEYALQGIDTTPVVDGGVYKLVYTNA